MLNRPRKVVYPLTTSLKSVIIFWGRRAKRIKIKYIRGFRSWWKIDENYFANTEPWVPYIFIEPPACPRCRDSQGGYLTEKPFNGGTLWTCFEGCGQRFWTKY